MTISLVLSSLNNDGSLIKRRGNIQDPNSSASLDASHCFDEVVASPPLSRRLSWRSHRSQNCFVSSTICCWSPLKSSQLVEKKGSCQKKSLRVIGTWHLQLSHLFSISFELVEGFFFCICSSRFPLRFDSDFWNRLPHLFILLTYFEFES